MSKSLIATAACLLVVTAGAAQAQDSLGNVSKASGDSAIAAAELTEAGVKVVAGTVALPFYAVGTAVANTGQVMRDSGQAVWDGANGPLDISPETVVAQPAPQVPYAAQQSQPQARPGNRPAGRNWPHGETTAPQ